MIADAYVRANNNAAAISYIEKLPKRTPELNATYQRLTYNQAIAEFNRKAFANVIVNLDKSLRNPVDEQINIAAQYLKAETYDQMGEIDKARPIYLQLSRDPKTGTYGQKSLYALGYIYYNQKDYKSALTYFRNFIAKPEGIDSQMLEDATTRLGDCYLAERTTTRRCVPTKGSLHQVR